MPNRRLMDSYGRVADDLRISVTDRCNFRCIYCMPAEGLKWLKRDDILRFEEIVRLARIFVARYGVRTIRITGGEPLVRVKLEELIAMINSIDPTLDITMTTNGVLLRQKAQALKDAGLKRINISLDTLRMDTFKDMARSQAFCTTCNRVRLTAEGGLRTCLFSLSETPLRDLMRSGVSDDHIAGVIETAIWRKEEGHMINKAGFIKPAKSMSQIGG